ncbi:hypothetical protein E3P92_03468 [Wallemia ichthyophaga]|uniref:Uncharacterized protein n=1 Tax=Wallemia ichthyophaga TaxID=245174 RepID=A0A4T0H8T9_WALIC|nr:hypothetical protein E3P98_00165 [Wallemia ichthyophaga]TIB09476.1 hypothetical protein E3P92_03468 [Wallemia ichthyophaga]TIB11888.1 hypothetical protein E3P90_02271 [Wallemia ichthyophaga]TIB24180.1 hypothetical protein E3P88_02227 [Wallemia ichthyophaga]TIB60226.1 hypothetical protein E3P78_03238 [Wallemia ichthyophaga]
MTSIQKAMGLEFLKYKVSNLEGSVEYKQSVVVDVTALLYGIEVLKRLDVFKGMGDDDIQYRSRNASAFIEKELKKQTIKLQESIPLTSNHYTNIINSLKLTSNASKLVVVGTGADVDRLNTDEITQHTQQSGYDVDLLLPAEIEDAALWSKQRKLKYLNKSKKK